MNLDDYVFFAELTENHNAAVKIVSRILDDLSGRSGLGDEWDAIDDKIKREIIEEWLAITRVALEECASVDE